MMTVANKEIFNTYGCQVSNDYLNNRQKTILQKLGSFNLLMVPRRKRGMTSSGKMGECHGNVYKLVKLYGGHLLFGYGVKKDVDYKGSRCVQLYTHSVWITPEGKLVDPTKSVNTYDYTYFLPIKRYENDNLWTGGCDYMFPDFTETCVLQGDKDHPKDMRLPLSVLTLDLTVRSVQLSDSKILSSPIHNSSSGFSKPSLFTGKTFDEIWMERTGLVA